MWIEQSKEVFCGLSEVGVVGDSGVRDGVREPFESDGVAGGVGCWEKNFIAAVVV